jgi:hypothetical protein
MNCGVQLHFALLNGSSKFIQTVRDPPMKSGMGLVRRGCTTSASEFPGSITIPADAYSTIWRA